MVLNYASLLEKESGSTAARVSALLDNLESSIAKMSERGQIARADKSIAVGIYRHQLLENGLHEYLRAKLASVPGYFNNEYAEKHKPPLRFILCRSPEYLAPYRTLLEMLLQNGCDPNRSHGKETPWTRCLKVYCRAKPLCDFFAALDTGIFEVYLQHGADPNALLDAEDCQGQTVQIPAWFEFFRVAPHVKGESQQAYERVLDVLLGDISSPHTSRHCDTDSSVPCELCQHNFQLARPMAIPDTLPDEGEFLFRVFEKAVVRTRRNQCAFDTCWFTECLSRINKDIENKLLLKTLEQGRINPRKRLLEEELQSHKIIKTI
ncbi:hypothetical protein FALBO_5409 [Fusarium albosuccineum]|uniref:Ankyrin repeat protein n=1 Tax=Fusarium albosuccineum TaxID=1237068 RepID=A0A8H4LE27_9HYPO|nr:hypothetical protein FALBO_5409 [Fusarium albosuccineum]